MDRLSSLDLISRWIESTCLLNDETWSWASSNKRNNSSISSSNLLMKFSRDLRLLLVIRIGIGVWEPLDGILIPKCLKFIIIALEKLETKTQ